MAIDDFAEDSESSIFGHWVKDSSNEPERFEGLGIFNHWTENNESEGEEKYHLNMFSRYFEFDKKYR